jgi:hypothetical protein
MGRWARERVPSRCPRPGWLLPIPPPLQPSPPYLLLFSPPHQLLLILLLLWPAMRV